MRPAGLSSGIEKDRVDYTVFCGEWNIGRIYEVRRGPEHLRWFWALHFPSKPEGLRTDNRVATLEAAKAEFEASWPQWLAWAKLGEVRAFSAGAHRPVFSTPIPVLAIFPDNNAVRLSLCFSLHLPLHFPCRCCCLVD